MSAAVQAAQRSFDTGNDEATIEPLLDGLSAVVADADDDDGLDGVARGVEVYGAGDAGKISGRCERVLRS